MSFHLQKISIPFIQKSVSDIWDQDIVFEQEKFYHIKAQSGKGKSTFIHSLYGIQKEINGNLFWKNKNTHTYTNEQWCDIRSKELSIVFQDLKLFEDKTALQNLFIKNELTNFYTIENINTMVEKLGITHTLNRNISTLSYGERQRVSIIRAMLQPFDTLLLDEPFSHLDTLNIQIASELILQEVQKRNATLIVCDLENDQHFPYQNLLNL